MAVLFFPAMFTSLLVTTHAKISQTEVFYGKPTYYMTWNAAVK